MELDDIYDLLSSYYISKTAPLVYSSSLLRFSFAQMILLFIFVRYGKSKRFIPT
jgi:hypothetical protein